MEMVSLFKATFLSIYPSVADKGLAEQWNCSNQL